MRFERRYVLGVPVDLATEQDTLDLVRQHVENRCPAQIVTVNAEFVMRAQRDAHFHSVISRSALSTADGAGILWALRRQGRRLPRRVGGSDLVWSISEQAARLGHRVFLLGGQEGVAAVAAETLRSRYPGLRIAGTFAGSPDSSQDVAIAERVRSSDAHILFVAFGAPQQELWIARNLEASRALVAIGVGGSLDYVAGRARRAPPWLQDHGLEWLWRLVRQPRRWRRMLALPRFAWKVITTNPDSDGD